jgi:hypothetical protein
MSNEAVTFVPSREQIEPGLRGATTADAVLVAQQYLRAGQARGALKVCEVARELGLAAPALWLCEASARFGLRDGAAAFECVQRVRAAEPDNPAALHLEANLMAASGRPAECRALLQRLVAVWPDYPGALAMLAAVLFPGPGYRDVLAGVHATLRPKTYLEIGVDTGATLSLAKTAEIAVGVDPAPPPDAIELPGTPKYYKMKSDSFFARETPERVFAGRPVDLAFIDGMHLFEFVLRDLANVERWCAPGSTVVLHDSLPPAAIAAERERSTTFWVGDVWKALDALLEYRPELRLSVVPTAPSGLLIVRGLNPASTVLADRMDEIVARYRDAPYPHEPGKWPARYRIVSNDAAGLKAALEA